MTVLRAFAIIAASGASCAFLGGLLGFLLGIAVPEYYRTVFGRGNAPGFDPVAVGVGLGTTQGLVGGLVIGVLVVFVVAWYNSRQRRSFIHSERGFASAAAETSPSESVAAANRPAASPSPVRAGTPVPPAGPAPRE